MWLFRIFSLEAMLSIGVLGAFALIWGGITQIRRSEDRQRGWLMIAAAVVLLLNVLILAV